MLKTIGNGFDERYLLDSETAFVYDKYQNKYLKPDKHNYKLYNDEHIRVNTNQRFLYELVYHKYYVIDNICDLEGQKWKEVKGTNNRILCSNKGRIKSYVYYHAHILKPSITNQGYQRLQITIDGLKRNVFVHVIIAETWIRRPNKIGLELHHIDQNRRNNCVQNLLYVTKKEHIQIHKHLNERNNV